jgi:DNA replication and repair protein RecF
MYLARLKISNFKNHTEAKLELNEKINCFVGDNGTGKTNILDSIYYLSFTKSYFNSVDSQNIRHGQDFFALHGYYKTGNHAEDQVTCIQQRGKKKQFRFNKDDYDRFSDHIGKIPLVMISPYDRDLINEGSEVRRKYLDGVLSQFDKHYLSDLLEYNKALRQRNTLLKQFAEQRYFDELSLQIWDEKMLLPGQSLFDKRRQFLEEFHPFFEKYYRCLSQDGEKVKIIYKSHLLENSFPDLLKASLQRDLALRYSSAGIHKDDLQLLMNGYPIKKFGSQGQQKSFVIAIKLAQFEYMRQKKGFKPILLFDDIFDKLDEKRVAQIVDLVSRENFGQVFITDTQPSRISAIFEKINISHKIFLVEHGTVKEMP